MDLPCLLFAGAEYCSRPSEGFLKIHCERVRAAEHAPRDPFHVLERRHGFAEIAKRGGGVLVEHPSVIRPHPERDLIILLESASRHVHNLKRFEEAKALTRKIIPVTRRVFGDSHEITLKMRLMDGVALFNADGAALDDKREAVTTLEDAGRIARRVLGGAHPLTKAIETSLRRGRAVLNARQE